MKEKTNLSLEGKVRIDILNAAYSAGKGGAHIAPSLSDADICLAILQDFNMTSDHFILSKGHGALGYYAAMHQVGMIEDEQFKSFEVDGGDFPGQPSRCNDNKIEYSSGSLGMGLPYALGVALGMKKRKTSGTVFVVTGDGELNEGSNWEAAALASQYDLDNLIVVVDKNDLQSDGNCKEIVGQNLNALWCAYGWKVEECDGHSIDALKKALKSSHGKKPLVIIASTVKGKGVSFMENNNAWHHAALNEEDFNKAVQEIGVAYGLY